MSTTQFNTTATISTKIYNYGYYPLLKSDIAPLFSLNREQLVSVQHFLDLQQPLVIAFLGHAEGASSSLKALSALHEQVLENGGNLIILTNNISRSFKKKVAEQNTLTVFFDEDNEIAEKFGLFDETNPLNNWLSGLDDANTALPALYVIAPDRQITFHHIDYQFSLFRSEVLATSIVESLLDNVSTLATSYNYLSKWRNKLVS